MTKRTTTEAELREWIAQGKTHREIAQMLGRNLSHIASACAVLGLTNGRRGRPLSEGVSADSYLACLRAGMTVREIAAKHDVSHPAVVQLLKRRGLPTCARKLLVAEAASQAQAQPA